MEATTTVESVVKPRPSGLLTKRMKIALQMSKNDISNRMMRNNGKISKLLQLSICLMLMVCAGSQLRAQAGSLDLAFNPGTGANGDVHAVAIQPDGKILIGGTFTQYAGTARNRIARLNTDGTLDLTFNPGTGCNGTVYAIAIQSDGKIVLGGAFTTYSGGPRNGMARLNANGSIDTGFTIGSGFGNGRVASISIQPNGFFVVGGTFTTFDGVGRNRILRLNASGGLDTSFNPGSGANNNVSATAIQTDGKILIGGIFIAFNGVNRNRIARLNANGTLDTGFANGNGFDDGVLCIRIQSDGKIVAGGQFTNYAGTTRSRMARLLTTGRARCHLQPHGDRASTTLSMPSASKATGSLWSAVLSPYLTGWHETASSDSMPMGPWTRPLVRGRALTAGSTRLRSSQMAKRWQGEHLRCSTEQAETASRG